MRFRDFGASFKAILVGGIFFIVGLVNGWNLLSARFWVQTPAVMESTRVVEQPSSTNTTYRLDVSYRWQHEGQTYHGSRYSFDGTVVEESQSKVLVEAARWPEGGAVTCWMNPRRPSEAVLDRDNGADTAIALTGIGLVILIVSIGGPVWVARGRRAVASDGTIPFPRGSIIWALVALVILGTSGGLAWSEWQQRASAEKGIETPCEILESRLTFSEYEFKPRIRFHWQVDGADFDATTVSLSTFEGSVLDAEKLIAAHPAGSHSVCWRNPQDPSQAVLDRSFHPGGLLFWLLSGAIGIFSAAAFLKSWLRWRRQRAHPHVPFPALVDEEEEDTVVSVAKAALCRDFEPLARSMPRVRSWSSLFKVVIYALLPSTVVLQQMLPVITREWHYGVWVTITQLLGLFAGFLWVFAAAFTVRILVSRFSVTTVQKS